MEATKVTTRAPSVGEKRPLGAIPSEEEAHANSPRSARTLTVTLIALLVVVIFAAFLERGVRERSIHGHELASDAAKTVSTPPRVYVVHPVASASVNWSLPGTTQAIQDATIYARVSGYLNARYVDIGDRVKAGQLLAVIDSPELEQQLNQAKANLDQAVKQSDLQKANLELAKTTMDSYLSVQNTGAVTKISVDQAIAGYRVAVASVAAAEATVTANQANVRQYEAMTAFERVLAPFAGVITQRNVDAGALITAGSPVNNNSVAPTLLTGAPTGLFEVSQIDTLRVFVSIPQAVAANVTVGMSAQVTIRGALTTPVAATVTRTANALDPSTRTLLTEVDIPNASHVMMPGQFVYVAFQIRPSGQRWTIPATALMFNAQGTQIWIVEPAGDSGGKLRLQNVTVGRDFGDTVDIQAGLQEGVSIVKQPDVSLHGGQVVTPIEPHQ